MTSFQIKSNKSSNQVIMGGVIFLAVIFAFQVIFTSVVNAGIAKPKEVGREFWTVKKNIDAEAGGYIKIDKRIRLVIPPNALEMDTLIIVTVDSFSKVEVEEGLYSDILFSFEPSPLTFNEPAYLTFYLDDFYLDEDENADDEESDAPDIFNESDYLVRLYYQNPYSKAWELVDDLLKYEVPGVREYFLTIDHFSRYALCGPILMSH